MTTLLSIYSNLVSRIPVKTPPVFSFKVQKNFNFVYRHYTLLIPHPLVFSIVKFATLCLSLLIPFLPELIRLHMPSLRLIRSLFSPITNTISSANSTHRRISFCNFVHYHREELVRTENRRSLDGDTLTLKPSVLF